MEKDTSYILILKDGKLFIQATTGLDTLHEVKKIISTNSSEINLLNIQCKDDFSLTYGYTP